MSRATPCGPAEARRRALTQGPQRTELAEAGSLALACGSLTDSRVQVRAVRLTALAVGSVQPQPSLTEPTSLWAVIDGTTTDPTILRNKNVTSVTRGTRYSSGNHVL